MAGGNLTPKQQRFVDEYLIDLNATQAAIRAGYAARAAKQQGARLLTNVDVQARLQAAMAERARATGVEAARVLRELAAVGFSDLGELVEFTADGPRFRPTADVPEQARRAVSSVKVRQERGERGKVTADVVEFKLWDKVSALTKLAQHLGLLKDQVEHTGTIHVAVSAGDMTDDQLAAIAAGKPPAGRGRTAAPP
jgi:phage terminase small subunit